MEKKKIGMWLMCLSICLAPFPNYYYILGFSESSAADVSEEVNIKWEMPRELVAVIKKKFGSSGAIEPKSGQSVDTKALPLIYIVAGLISLPSLIEAITDAIRDIRCGGVVIIPGNGDLRISCEPKIQSGTVVIYDKSKVDIIKISDGGKEIDDLKNIIDIWRQK